jgi:hypothetical protein
MLAFLRFLAGVLLLVAALALAYDATRTSAAGTLVTTSMLEHWSKIAPATLAAAQGAVRRGTHPLLWDAGIARLLLAPTWAVFGGAGLLLAFAGRRRRRVNIYAN